MLTDTKLFAMVEDKLRANGKLKAFEDECGPVTGRMMITLTEFPEQLMEKPEDTGHLHSFECSFDFYDCSLGINLYTDRMETVGGLWVTEQTEGAEPPAHDWVEFFIKTLVNSIEPDGSFGYPICSFLNDTADMTVVPTRENA